MDSGRTRNIKSTNKKVDSFFRSFDIPNQSSRWKVATARAHALTKREAALALRKWKASGHATATDGVTKLLQKIAH